MTLAGSPEGASPEEPGPPPLSNSKMAADGKITGIFPPPFLSKLPKSMTRHRVGITSQQTPNLIKKSYEEKDKNPFPFFSRRAAVKPTQNGSPLALNKVQDPSVLPRIPVPNIPPETPKTSFISGYGSRSVDQFPSKSVIELKGRRQSLFLPTRPVSFRKPTSKSLRRKTDSECSQASISSSRSEGTLLKPTGSIYKPKTTALSPSYTIHNGRPMSIPISDPFPKIRRASLALKNPSEKKKRYDYSKAHSLDFYLDSTENVTQLKDVRNGTVLNSKEDISTTPFPNVLATTSNQSLINDYEQNLQEITPTTKPSLPQLCSFDGLSSGNYLCPQSEPNLEPSIPIPTFPESYQNLREVSPENTVTLLPPVRKYPDGDFDKQSEGSEGKLLKPPSDHLISDKPRRDSAWTAEVLSIEIRVDYVMDPSDLWGNQYLNKQAKKDLEDDDTRYITMDPDKEPQGGDNFDDAPDRRDQINDVTKPTRVAEVGVVLPMVSDGTGGDERRPSDTIPPEKFEIQDPPDPDRRDSKELNLPPREHWDNNYQFLLSAIGYAVDLSNVWRFPFLCYKNGGGAFLIPYFTTLIFGAMPVFFMEMAIGQFHRSGPTAVWEKMAPMFKGIGLASCFMAYIVAFYYNIIIGWSFFYLFASFTSSLPWTSCFNDFNSDNCWQLGWDINATATNVTSATTTASISGGSGNTNTIDVVVAPAQGGRPLNRTYTNSSVSSTMEFFERGMLELHESTGLEDLGQVRWQLALCTLLTFTVLYFCLWKGVKSTGKVVYVTATLPYLIMTILLVRGVLLPGAEDGIRYFITPKIDSLRKPKVWIDAAVQIFFSVGTGFGTHIAYASYNKFHNDCRRDCIITVVVNSFTSLFSGFVIFSYLGYMSLKTSKDIDKVATEGPGLVFIVYPEAIATLPGSVGWSIIFFFMLLALGLDSAFGGLESPLTGLRDELSCLTKYKYFREILTLIVITSAFIFSTPCLTQGGMYVFTILDTFAAGTSIVFIVLCEVVAVSWFYGMPQFCADVKKMTGQAPSMFWRVCWKFICPLLLTTIVLSSVISYKPLSYASSKGVYTYPYFANVVGWIIALSSMLMVPGYMIYRLIRSKGNCTRRLALGMSPEWEHDQIEENQEVKRFHKEHWISI